MEIKALDNRTYDVFWGNGWYNWARMQSGSKGYWRLLKGQPMPKKVFSEFKEIMNGKDESGSED